MGLTSTSTFAQGRKCGNSEQMEKLQLEDPATYEKLITRNARQIAEIKKKIKNKSGIEKSATKYIVPIVFHILHV